MLAMPARPKIPANHARSRYRAYAANPIVATIAKKAKNIPHQFILPTLCSL